METTLWKYKQSGPSKHYIITSINGEDIASTFTNVSENNAKLIAEAPNIYRAALAALSALNCTDKYARGRRLSAAIQLSHALQPFQE